MKVNQVALGLRWGALLASLEQAHACIKMAHANRDLLSKDERERLVKLLSAVADSEFGSWAEFETTRKKSR